MSEFFSLLTTSLGTWGICAGVHGVTAVIRDPAPPLPVVPAVPYDVARAWEAYESGLADSLHLPTDHSAPPRAHLFYLAVRKIPRGETRTLEQIAFSSGITVEETETLLSDCPLPLVIPTHRVTGWSFPEPELQAALLALESMNPRLERIRTPWK